MKMKYTAPEVHCIKLDTEEVLLFSANPIIPDSSKKPGEDAKDFGNIELFQDKEKSCVPRNTRLSFFRRG